MANAAKQAWSRVTSNLRRGTTSRATAPRSGEAPKRPRRHDHVVVEALLPSELPPGFGKRMAAAYELIRGRSQNRFHYRDRDVDDPVGHLAYSTEFGRSAMVGGHAKQEASLRVRRPYLLKASDAEANPDAVAFFDEWVAPLLKLMWESVERRFGRVAAQQAAALTKDTAIVDGTGYNHVTIARDNATTLHQDIENELPTEQAADDLGGEREAPVAITSTLAFALDVEMGEPRWIAGQGVGVEAGEMVGSLVGGSHVLYAKGGRRVIVVEDRADGILAMGDYARCAHGNLATVRGGRLLVNAYMNAKAVERLRGEAEEDWEEEEEEKAEVLSAYEQQRQASIADNIAKLRELGII